MAKKSIKTKTKIIKKSLPEGYYHKNGQFIKESDKFIYEMLVHEFTKNGACLADSKETSIKEFKGFSTTEIIEKGKNRYMKTIDLISAPKTFLIENNFKLITNG